MAIDFARSLSFTQQPVTSGRGEEGEVYLFVVFDFVHFARYTSLSFFLPGRARPTVEIRNGLLQRDLSSLYGITEADFVSGVYNAKRHG